MLPAMLRRSLSRRFVISSVIVLLTTSSVVTWHIVHASDIDLAINTGTTRRPLVVVGGKVVQMPSGDYLDPTTLVDTSGCSSTNVIKWNGTQFTCSAGGGVGTVTNVGSGSGIFGGPITSTGNFAIDPTYTQRRVTGTCSSPNAISIVAQDGTVTCTTGVVDTAGTSLWKSGSTLNVGLSPVTCGAGSAVTAIGSNGTGTCAAVGGGGGTGSLTVSTGAFPGTTTNLSTVGTFDWFWYGNTGNPGTGAVGGGVDWSSSTSTSLHAKKGGELYRSFTWVGHGVHSSTGVYPGVTTFTSTASDDNYSVAMSATDGTYDVMTATGLGYQINVSASTTSRTLRLYTGAKGVITTISASLDDGSATPASATFSAASGVHVFQSIDIVFQAASSTRLRVTVLATTLNGGVQDEDFFGMAEF